MALDRYLTEEIWLDHRDGQLSRREALRLLGLMGLGAASAMALLDAEAASAATATTKPRRTTTRTTRRAATTTAKATTTTAAATAVKAGTGRLSRRRRSRSPVRQATCSAATHLRLRPAERR